MAQRLKAAHERFAVDPALRVMLIRATGRYFSAGAGLEQQHTPAEAGDLDLGLAHAHGLDQDNVEAERVQRRQRISAARASPPVAPRAGIDRTKTPASVAWRRIRTRSPSPPPAPPVALAARAPDRSGDQRYPFVQSDRGRDGARSGIMLHGALRQLQEAKTNARRAAAKKTRRKTSLVAPR